MTTSTAGNTTAKDRESLRRELLAYIVRSEAERRQPTKGPSK
jgi:hypothetical protein